MTTNIDLDQAREVADTIAQSPKAYDSGIQAVARVIASLPDEWIDADKLREFIQDWREGIAKHPGRGDGRAEEILTTLESDFLTPQPRTLADTGWDDNVHPYMEAVTISGRRHILLAPMGYTAVSENTILVAEHGGGVPVLVPADALTPTGRYARLSLPDEEGVDLRKAVEALRDDARRSAYLSAWLSQFGTVRIAPVFDEVADTLTRILEGEA